MKKKILAITTIVAAIVCTSCNDTKSYAEYVSDERHHIQEWIDYNDIVVAGKFDEEQINDMAEAILEDSICPSEFIELGKWYQITDGYYKRMLFRVNSWGNEYPDMRSSKKFFENENVLVRYQNLLNLSDYNYTEPEKNIALDNLDPNSYEVCYSWNRNYYCYQGYAYSYGTGSSYECTSGGVGFPIRFLWQGGEASVIVPFNLIPSTFSSYYYTLYYGTVRYTKPNYLPQ